MISSQSKKIVRVALVALPDIAPAGLYSLLEVFSAVGTVWEDLTGQYEGDIRVKVDVVAEDEGLMYCGLGVPVISGASFGSAAGYDLVIVSDIQISPEHYSQGKWDTATQWIRTQHAAGSIVGSVCTGSLVLAEAKLLNGLEATTHWSVVSLFKQYYPKILLKPDKVLSLAASDQRIITAGGASSWVELALYFIAHFFGKEEAVRITKVFLLGDRSEGQLPFAALTRPKMHTDVVIDNCQVWIAEHYDEVNPVERMTECSGLESRTFKRRFRAATGYAPLDYVQTLRIEEAKYLLEASDMPTDKIGTEIGYEDPASFRRLFKRKTGITPARYRRRYQNIGFVLPNAD